MLTNKIIIITGESEFEGIAIAKFLANINLDTSDISFSTQQINKEACKEHSDIFRADRVHFEDMVYSIQDDTRKHADLKEA